jgi:hypothetical protein
MLDDNGEEIMITSRNPETGKTERVPKPMLDAAGNVIMLTEEEKDKAWLDFQPKLMNFFLASPKMDASAKQVLHYIPLASVRRHNENE